MNLITNEINEFKKNISPSIILIVILLHYIRILGLLYYIWKIFLLLIFIKTIILILLKLLNIELSIFKLKKSLTSKIALTLYKKIKHIKFKFKWKEGCILLIKIIFIVVIGYSIKFINIILKIINMFISNLNHIKYKSFRTTIYGIFFYLKKSILDTLENEFIFKI